MSTLSLATCGYFFSPPFMESDSDGNASGPVIDYIESVLAQVGHSVRFTYLSQADLNEFAESSFDLAACIFSLSSRSALGDYSRPLFHTWLQVLASRPKGSTDPLAQLAEMRVAVRRGDVGEHALTSWFGESWVESHAKVLPAASSESLLELLEGGQIDALVSDLMTLEYLRAETRTPTHFWLDPYAQRIDAALLVRRQGRLRVIDVERAMASPYAHRQELEMRERIGTSTRFQWPFAI